MAVDTIQTFKYPPPPKLPETISSLDDVQNVVDKLRKYFNSTSVSYNQLYNVLHEGTLIDTWQINNLTVGTLQSGTITSDKIYLGGPQFELDGILQQIRIKDDQDPPVTRVEMGSFGGGTDYGLKMWDEDGNVIMDISGLGPSVVKDIHVATAADIDGSKLKALSIEGAQIANATIASAKIVDLSASKISTGTLLCNSTNVAIDVTEGGVVLFENGADLIMKKAVGDTSYIKFQDGNGIDQGKFFINTTAFSLQGPYTQSIDMPLGSKRIELSAKYTILSDGSSAGRLIDLLGATVNSSLIPTGTFDLGSSGAKWDNIWVVTQHVGDSYFANNFCISEANKVFAGMKLTDGLFFLNDKNEPIMFIDGIGNLHLRGTVIEASSIFQKEVIKVVPDDVVPILVEEEK